MGSNKKNKIMKNPIEDFYRFRNFLKEIPLKDYRKESQEVKWVEQDLPKELLPLDSIFKYYWHDRNFLNFEEWFDAFWKEINTNEEKREALRKFKKYNFNKDLEENDWFKKGFKMRMWRTWISVLTQLDFCYLFEYLCAQENRNLILECNAELDKKGIDAKVGDVNFQVGKISYRPESRRVSLRKIENLVTVPYLVVDKQELKRKIESKRVKEENKKHYEKLLEIFDKYFIQMENGFIVFKEDYLKVIIDNINDITKIKEKISQIFNFI